MSQYVKRPGVHVCGRGHETEFAVEVKPTAEEMKAAAVSGTEIETHRVCPACEEPTMLKIVRDGIARAVGGIR